MRQLERKYAREVVIIGVHSAKFPNEKDTDAVRQAILLLIAHWHEHREPVEIGAASVPVPPMVCDLLQPYRPVRL